MFDPKELDDLRTAIRERTERDRGLLEDLREDARALRGRARAIRPYSTTSVSLVASDGGNNRLVFDPFSVQIVRVVDSQGKVLCLEAVSPTTNTDDLCRAQYHPDGSPKTALGLMMRDLGIDPPSLNGLSYMIPSASRLREQPDGVSPSWVMAYRDLVEWAALYERVCHRSFAADTLIVRDGLLRSSLYRGDYFGRLCRMLEEAIERIYREDKRRVFIVGIAKRSKVLQRYGLAMAVENTLPAGEPRFVPVPPELEAKAYSHPEWLRDAAIEASGPRAQARSAGSMHFVRFGKHSGDPIWTVDILSSQGSRTAEILGYLLGDALEGFPVPFYPRCLQRAHEHAQIADFDLEILQDVVCGAVRDLVPEARREAFDALQLQADMTARRYA